MPSLQVIVKARGPGVKGPVIVAVLPATVTVPALTVTSSGSPSKVTVIVPLAGIGAQGGWDIDPDTDADTKETGTLSSSLSSSLPHPTKTKAASETTPNNTTFLKSFVIMTLLVRHRKRGGNFRPLFSFSKFSTNPLCTLGGVP